jgi:metal-responsive CopG/Arc/MetJ family transcriptional regulator
MPKTRLVAVRVTPDTVRSLDEVAAQQSISRSELIRDLLENCHSLYRFLQAERQRQGTEKIILNGNLSQWVIDNMPHGMTPEQVRFIAQTMSHAADMMVVHKGGKGK